jgi:hypothetical protein
MKATCPNNPEHETFYTVAHVLQEWPIMNESPEEWMHPDYLAKRQNEGAPAEVS